MMRSIIDCVEDPHINAHTIEKMVIEKNIYNPKTLQGHYQAVEREIIRYLNGSRVVDMASLEAYANLLRHCRDLAIRFTVDCAKLKQKRYNDAWEMFNQMKEEIILGTKTTFMKEYVEVSNL